MFEFLKDINNYDERKVAKTEVGTCKVSTVYTSDEGYETAIIDAEGEVHPVERYATKELSIIGHEKWCENVKTVRVVNKLGGLHGLIGDKLIYIKK